MAYFEIKGLKKSFGNNEVLKGIDLTLEKGEVLAIIGSSGGGKTTLLRSMNFLETPNAGEIWIDGARVFGMDAEGNPEIDKEAQRMMGLVFQQFNLFPQYNVMGNLTLAPKLHAKERADFKINKKQIYAEIDARAEEIIEFLKSKFR